MRSVGLGTLVVAVIFAAAFGVYFWLIGDPEPEIRVSEPVTQTSQPESQETASVSQGSAATGSKSETQSSSEAKATDVPAEQSETPNSPAQQQANAATEQTQQASQSAQQPADAQQDPQSQEGTVAVLPSLQDEASQSLGSTGTSGSEASGNAAKAVVAVGKKPARPKAPQVVARVDPSKQVTSPDPAPNTTAGPAPSFDVVRVEKTGEAILAGRAPANSEVTIYDGDIPLGIVKADSRGQWVLILDVPLQPGSHSLGIVARQKDDSFVESEELVIVAVPEPQRSLPPAQDLAEAATESPADQSAGSGSQAEAASQLTEIAPASGEGQPSGEAKNAEAQVAAVTDPAGDATAESPTEPLSEPVEDTVDVTPEPEDIAESPVAPSQLAAADAGVEEPIAVIVPRHGTGPTRILQQPELLEDGIGNGSLFLDSVDYDDEGRAVIGGRAAPGASLIIYLDNLPIGEAFSDDGGRWVMTPDNLVPVGLHQLRVDQIERDGRVLARVETPFSRADTVESHPDENFVTVQPGNSLWRIARAAYGRGTRYTVIYESNKTQIRDPDLIYPGQIFRLPSDG